MSADLFREVEANADPKKSTEPRLWHIAADDLHDRRVDMGMSWLTLCGQMLPPASEQKWSLGGETDDCPVCDELEFADLP